MDHKEAFREMFAEGETTKLNALFEALKLQGWVEEIAMTHTEEGDPMFAMLLDGESIVVISRLRSLKGVVVWLLEGIHGRTLQVADTLPDLLKFYGIGVQRLQALVA